MPTPASIFLRQLVFKGGMIKKTFMRVALIIPTLCMLLFVATSVLAQSSDTSAPTISNVQIVNSTGTAVTVKWETNEDADSAVNFGLTPDYGMMRVPVADRKTHSITLSSLDPGRTYFFRVISADVNGNQGISADYKIQTDEEIGRAHV